MKQLLELFDSRDKKKRMSHIRNLVALACSDGNLDKNEMELISRIGLNGGLEPEELKRIFNRPESVKFYAPDSFKERFEQLYDMVMVMMIDGEFHQNEVALCKMTAIKLGFKHEVIDIIVRETIEMIAEGIATEMAFKRLQDLVA